ncbi:MAG: efflux RND transporter periplasmic adaptor subunit [Gracilimonas sp.]|nr:efflux RND transporter periplasmic adaptor subunit [Gracilimonas sp.]
MTILLIFSTEPEASRETATKETPMLVQVIEAKEGAFKPTISATGTVIPSQEVMLSPRVSGQVINRSPNFTPGRYVEKGEVILQIDPSDYETALIQAQSNFRQAKSELQRELGLQQAAQREFELLEDSLSPANRALVLREPQLEAAKARVDAAEAAVKQAELNLERTQIRAPFTGHVLTRNINVGSLVSPGQNLGQLVDVSSYWVETTVPISKLRWLNFETNPSESGSAVQVKNRSAWDINQYRSGYLYSRIGSLENETRMARVLVAVPDPLAQSPENEGMPELIIGSFLQVDMQAFTLEDVIRLNRDYLRQNSTVWVMQNDTLSIREVNIQFQDEKFAYINAGLDHREKIITTNLATVRNGAPLRLSENTTMSSETETGQ